jgi:hypothetical protein
MACRHAATASPKLGHISQNIAQIAVGFGVVGPQGDRPAIGGDRVIELAFLSQRGAEIVMGPRRSWA